jgi:DNA invertase Pin-like site-specific DNA recombinase
VQQNALVPVAQYLRMSTEDQQYSTANQHDAILRYAVQHGFEVVRTYEDAAKSGMVLRYRKGLSKLLHDVVSGPVSFRAILVYDVSRWGRFQDTDEAAHYEFLCKKAGVPIHYCAEQFSNDGTLPSSLLKALKRTMAGEYSRELSVKSFAGQMRVASIGFRPGGTPGYGFRRLAVSADGRPRRRLSSGERKGFPTDRVILVPGPKKEVEQVRNIYRTFIRANGRIGPSHIAEDLNRKGIKAANGNRWTTQSLRELLSNPKYAGMLVWGRTTQKLCTAVVAKPKDTWLVKENAFARLIDQRTFARAQLLLERRARNLVPDAELLRCLRKILSRQGRISRNQLGKKNGAYSNCTYHRRFGSLRRAYDLVGFKYSPVIFDRRASGAVTEQIRDALLRNIVGLFPAELTPFRLPTALRRSNLILDGKFKLYVWLARSYQTKSGRLTWRLRTVAAENDGITLVGTLRPGNFDYDGFYVFPTFQLSRRHYTFGADDPLLQKGVRLDDLSQLCSVAREVLVANSVPVPRFDWEDFRASRLLHNFPIKRQ